MFMSERTYLISSSYIVEKVEDRLALQIKQLVLQFTKSLESEIIHNLGFRVLKVHKY